MKFKQTIRKYFCQNTLYSKRNNHQCDQFIVRRFQRPLVYIDTMHIVRVGWVILFDFIETRAKLDKQSSRSLTSISYKNGIITLKGRYQHYLSKLHVCLEFNKKCFLICNKWAS